ncbi:hypothetical protein BV22DRAFT_128309 [Leucogyrophana mollusca]|uniref:Uncharacterized protein n=1 Tax=Leucogyrophana mollusca TaxID=85980 RepID=A0ACB8BXT9_9AGAM|nr:hypothetical protein BV22DRAFT_128309 [Leucogyrophana mollusca]
MSTEASVEAQVPDSVSLKPRPSRPRRPTREIPATPATDSKQSDETDPATVLTPLRAHYLKKSLIQLQFHRELDDITSAPADNNVSTLAYLGPPFTPPPRGSTPLDLPFLRYIFRQFVLTFPFMASAPKDFYSEKLQPFVASVFARNLSPTSIFDDDSDNSEQATRLKTLAKVERNLALFFGAGTKVVEPEEVVRLKQSDLDRLETLAKKRLARMNKNKEVFEVNIVCVRTVTDRGRMRSRVHEEFIIRTRLSEEREVCVSRRYGDFKTLADELRKAHPDEGINSPPAKDRTTVNVPSSNLPFMSRTAASSMNGTFSDGSTESLPQSPSHPGFPSRLSREKNRLTLRAYLHSLMASSSIASSPVLRSFLLSGPTTLSAEEQDDARRREEADRLREDGRKRFAQEIASRVDGLRDAVKSVKGDVMGKDGLTHVFATIKVTPDVRGLPSNYQAVLEWARISLASTIFQMLVAADNSSETFASLKRIHGLMPYFVLKTALKISNPVYMIRSVLDIFLAQPFGGRSLLQRMFTSSLTEEVKALEEDIEAVKAKVDDEVICEKIRLFVYAPREIQDTYKADAGTVLPVTPFFECHSSYLLLFATAEEKHSLLTIVLRSGEEPVLNRSQMQRVIRSHHAHAAYLRQRDALADSDDDDGPQDDDAWLFEDLKVLSQLYSRLRDREQLIALIFEGVTSELLKDIITIFYAPLAQVYRAASIADSLGDMQNFINDLIRTVEQTEELSQEDPHRTVQMFIDLVKRHEQSFYSFVHKVHSKGEGLFDSLMKWIELFLTVVREGIGDPISLEYLLPHGGDERRNILAEVDAITLYHYKLKVAYENKVRRRFGKAQGQHDADAEDEATQALVHGVVGEINFGELVQGDADDLAAEETDDESEEDSSEYETDSSGSYEDDSSEENIPAKAPPRSPSARPAPRRPLAPPPTQEPPSVRKRAFSLRSAKSMTFSRSSPNVRDVPPVPPIPTASLSELPLSRLDKPLPPQPSVEPSAPQRRRSNEEHLPPQDSRPPPPPPKPRRAKGKAPNLLKPPDLHHIPQLLPVFVEMMRPNLRRKP